jgi:2,3-bisphosphoglycerate-independent phosphoglycerate mutase
VKILFIFIDGLGIGENDESKNPCTSADIQLFNNFLSETYPKKLPFDGLAKSIDCTLGIPGLPQSATGQTALYTGLNAAKILGKHLSGFPNQKLRDILTEHSILQKGIKAGKKAAFINAYRQLFFELGPEALIRFLSVTSIMNWKAGLKFFDMEDLQAERCIYHDFTNRELLKKGFKVPEFSPEKAGQILAHASHNYDFLLYEYFKTDRAGHKQDLSKAADLLIQLEQFILTVLKQIDLKETLLIVTSDHGNIEDISVKTHTKNPVPLMVWGKRKQEMLDGVESILGVTSSILKMLTAF